jgi:phosphatidylserine/phosphatidylglycerophosphate/cardiolipin synthase-like enzyme
VQEAELVGGVLLGASDPTSAASVLLELLSSTRPDPAAARAAGLEPILVESLKRKLRSDHASLEIACASGAGWALGRRSSSPSGAWEVVASLPPGTPLPRGLRRTTGETMIGMAASAKRLIRLSAPYVDEPGIRYLLDSIAASTARGVAIELFDPRAWEPARAAVEALERAVNFEGDPSRLRVVQATKDAPFAHLKVMVVDSATAYVGSANLTAAGLAGRNLELGVVVSGPGVFVIDRILDLYKAPSNP